MADDGSGSGSDGEAKVESRGKMTQRHKREVKELKNTTTKMLHGVPKNDKKKKAEVEAQVAALEAQMLKRHEAELASLSAAAPAAASAPAASSSAPAPAAAPSAPAAASASPSTPAAASAAQPKAKTKAQQKREAKDRAELERQARVREEKANTVSARQAELDALAKRLAPLRLEVKEIPSDGNCLFAAVADQLRTVKGDKSARFGSIGALRSLAAAHIRAHRAEYEPFLAASEDGLGDGGVDAYCTRLETTPLWGGEVEIRALSEALQVPLVVYSADMAPHVVGAETEAPLRLSFHRHYLSLGAHYNSVVPALAAEP